uniref:Uncharacterized protein n=1 Tax=Opuntia streptacantha TaxID=393608 RepID=A0A7C9EKN2_OPUST
MANELHICRTSVYKSDEYIKTNFLQSSSCKPHFRKINVNPMNETHISKHNELLPLSDFSHKLFPSHLGFLRCPQQVCPQLELDSCLHFLILFWRWAVFEQPYVFQTSQLWLAALLMLM